MERAEELFEKIKRDGNSAIKEFILTRKAEELFLDFKQSADSGTGRQLHSDDLKNLRKAISGFANSQGGVIVWGVDCSKDFDGSDLAKAKCPITNVKRFVSWLNGAISGCTIPPHTGVQNHPLEIDANGNGFAVTYIPKSEHAPHQEIPSRKYYIRAGSSFTSTPHDVLAGMFGKRPQPNIKADYIVHPIKVDADRVRINIGFHICNDGPGIAESLFASALSHSEPRPNCPTQFVPPDKGFRRFKSDNCSSIIGGLDIRLPPGGRLEVAQMILDLTPPFTKQLKIEATLGCSNAPPLKFVFQNSAENIQSWYDRIFPILKTSKYDDKKRTEIVNELLGIKTP
ncbi:MAG: AlbA family DNA-binding domain-containing protein [Planctomycetota bacterium]|jgi:hypothetical protein